ncbi:MAG: carbamoyltransferase [Candidatus Zixiibacteriota bacterium]|nr:MAG: carbamoyltransferase [candidate division Zixibacteria bacterium]
MNILGISCFYHDSAASLVRDGLLAAAVLEERFTGVKHDSDFPSNAVNFCLEKEGLRIDDIDYIVFYDKPFTKFDRILNSYLQTAPVSYPAFRKAIPVWLRQKLWLPQIIRKELGFQGELLFVEHHLSHAAGTYYCSPFDKAAILTIDGVGEWATASVGEGRGNKIELQKVMNYPHSVGLLYSAFTYFLGFRVNSAEYKVMGLAPYGEPVYADLIKSNIVRIFDDGSIHLNLKYFEYHYGLRMTGKRFEKLLGRPRRSPESELTESDRNIAASIQAVTEEIVFKMARHAKDLTGLSSLCLSGGVALNCAAAGKLLQSRMFDDMYVQPPSSDAGGAIGAALYAHYSMTDSPKRNDQPYFTLGPAFTESEIKEFIESENIPHSYTTDDRLSSFTAGKLVEGKIVALFHGPMEFGPRALGFRSILADARDREMKAKINRAVKFRETFRPFAPVVTEESAPEYFESGRPSPYMLFNFEVKEDKREIIPAVTHKDNTARIQTVNRSGNPPLYDILKSFEKETGVPVVLNTSFNLRGRPIVRTPQEAFSTFLSSGIDVLILGNFVIEKINIDAGRFERFKITTRED